MRLIRLKPITEPPTLPTELEHEIQRVITREIYFEVLKILRMKPKTVIKNSVIQNSMVQSDYEQISKAMHSGTLTWNDGMFTGSLDAGLTRALKAAGATWDKRLGAFRLAGDDLTADLSHLISITASDYEERMKKVDNLLKGIKAEEVSNRVAVKKLFENAITRTEKQFKDNVSAVTLTPALSTAQKNALMERWEEQARHSIKGLVEDQVTKLRGRVAASVEKGNRYSNLVKGIQHEYGVSQSRAKLISRQETKGLVNSYALERYEDAGVKEYTWSCVHGTPAHPVRPLHQALADESKKGKTYRFDDPPVISPDGRRGNPGDDFNCVTGDSKVNFLGSAKKLFRRTYTGKLSVLTTKMRTLRITPNHPVLTSRGWVPAKDVQVGDDLVEVAFDVSLIKAQYKDNRVSSFKELFSFNSISSDVLRRVPASAPQFHGDMGVNQDVDVIRLEEKLMCGFYAKIRQFFHQFKFTSSDVMSGKSSGSPFSYFYALAHGLSIFSNSFIGRCRQGSSFLWGSPGHANVHRIGDVSDVLNSQFFKTEVDGTTGTVKLSSQGLTTSAFKIKFFDSLRRIFRDGVSMFRACRHIDILFSKAIIEDLRFDAEHLSNTFNRQPFFKQLDRVLNCSSIDVDSFHVYNLETEVGWYSCNGLVVHNCRCRAIPIVRFGGR